MTVLATIGKVVAWPFMPVAQVFVWALTLTGDQIRALMCWAMLFGTAVMCASNIGLTYGADHAVHGSVDHGPVLKIITEQIRYNAILQGLMIFGVVSIAIQAGTIKAKIGDIIDIDATLRQAAQNNAGRPMADVVPVATPDPAAPAYPEEPRP